MNRFGSEIATQDIIDALSFFDSWEDRYRYIIDLGKEIPELDAEHRREENLIRGCQSQVWIKPEITDGKVFFHGDSDALITKGLVALLIRVLDGQPAQAIANADDGAGHDDHHRTVPRVARRVDDRREAR